MAGVDVRTILTALLGLTFLVACAVVWALDRPRGRWGAALRRRFVAGVPWGTLTVTAFVLGVYLFVQGGLAHWYRPVVIPFRAWSYFYPLGMLTAAFAHNGPGHILGNLAGVLALAPIVEYAWGHFPRERGSRSFGSLGTNPVVRAFVLFPAVVVAVGLLTALFAVGPIIGFSGVVFAFGGFALVRYPYATLVALLVSRTLGTIRVALQNPILVAEARPTFYSPWWAQVAIQGHALGLLIGALLGFWFVRTREWADRPSALRLWTAVVLFAVTEGLWAVYWYRGGVTYVLYRGVGVVLVFVLATLLTAAATASSRPLFDERLRQIDWRALAGVSVAGAVALAVALSQGWLVGVTVDVATVPVPLEWVGAAVLCAVAVALVATRPRVSNPLAGVPRRETAAVLLLLGLAALAGPAVPVNLAHPSAEPLPGQPTAVRGYEVTYAENVTSGMVSIVDVEAFGETTAVRTSGVIVRNQRRGIWTTAVSKQRLAFAGEARVPLGGVGWRRSVRVSREGWTVAGGGAAYRVAFGKNRTRRVVYTSDPATASPVVSGRNVSVGAEEQAFDLVVSRNNSTLDRTRMPGPNASVLAGGLRFTRRNETVYVSDNGTRIAVAREETYN
ncbi:MAG: rhomboid family intramembrane serine protease [Haloferacaceae archaeon]